MKLSLPATAMLMLLLTTGLASANGLLVPEDKSIPPLAIKHQRVTVEIDNGVAQTTVKQVFANNTDRDLEAIYIFPLPREAAIGDFTMMIGGKKVKGEILEKDKAAAIYQSIVSRMKDPGLLEYADCNLLRVKVYPVPRHGDQEFELSYSQVLKFGSGIYSYVYPLRTGESASRTLEDFTVAASLKSKTPIKSIYSPSHKVSVSRKSDRDATIGFEENQSLLDRDFTLYYTVSEKDVGLNLLCHREKGEDGYFVLLLAPKNDAAEKEILDKDVIFVLDTSGSMTGEKIKRAKDALKYCVNSLRKGDRFNIIRFSTDVDSLSKDLAPASERKRSEAIEYVDDIEARGGTAIDDALAIALDSSVDPKRTLTIVFLTDGKPTIGETDTDSILKNVARNNKSNVRIFVFGVGDDVNTHLLDRLASESRGQSEYVKPNEEIESTVSAFFDKVSCPVLTDVSLDFGKIKVYGLYPQKIGDLFRGSQITLIGRYKSDGSTAVWLRGSMKSGDIKEAYDAEFVESEPGNDFIPKLWASRKIGHLLEEIRQRGENNELKDEVIRLSKEHGIATPYTSYLVVEDERDKNIVVRRSQPRPPAEPQPYPMPFPRDRDDSGGKIMPLQSAAPAASAPAEYSSPSFREEVRKGMSADSGADAVKASKQIGKYKRSEQVEEKTELSSRTVASRTFSFDGKTWSDDSIKADMPVMKIKYGSEAYFAIWKAKPKWRDMLKLGSAVRFRINGKVLAIGEDGKESLTKDELKELTK